MRQYCFWLLLGLSFTVHSFSQGNIGGTVRGRLVDTAGKQHLGQASVSARTVEDSSSSGFAVTDKEGAFLLKGLAPGNYRLLISFQGYGRINKRFTISAENKDIDFGTIYMQKASDELEAVVVERPPIQIKEDTVEYSAGAFKVKPNAIAEDLLKKLPGVQVDKDGNVTAQGEQVQKVYVDGKEFFGTDPKLATKNLTADMIESVQVFDDMSDQAKFTKIDDGSRQKALNIKLKKDKRKGYFGRAVAGYGTDQRYQSTLTFNRFNEDQRWSFIGASNNVNQQGFAFSDIVTSMGGYGSRNAGGAGGGAGAGGAGGGGFAGGGAGFRGGGGGNSVSLGSGTSQTGITKATSAGLNYTDKYGSKLLVAGNYFFSHTENNVGQNIYRQSFFPGDSSTNQTDLSNSRSINQNHRWNLRLEYKLDSSTSLLFIPSLTLQHSESYNYDSTRIAAIKGLLDYKAIDGYTNNSSVRNGTSLNNNLLLRHRFKTPGRTITVGWQNTINDSKGSGANYAPLRFYKPNGSLDSTSLQDLETSQRTKSNNNVLSLSYTEPVGAGKLIEFNYAYNNNYTTSDRRAFNYNPGTKSYDLKNLLQTNFFGNGAYSNRWGANFRVVKTKYNFQLGLGVQLSELVSHSKQALNNKDTIIKQSFVNLIPVANFNYKFSNTRNLRISYRGRTVQPSIAQLQNVPDVSNPLQVITGNPALKQEFDNNLNVRYNTFNPSTYKYLSVNIILNDQLNNMVNSIDSMGHGVQITKPVNLNGALAGTSFITLGIPLRGQWKGSNFNFNNSIAYNRIPSLLYQELNISNTLVITQTAGVNLDFNEKLNLGLNGSLAYNNATYSLQKSQNSSYFLQTYTADISYYVSKDWILYTDFSEYINSGRSSGFNQTIPLWNASVARQLGKKRNAEIKLSVNDILNQNQSITRTIGDNYTQDTRSTVLKRYLMLVFTYNLNRGGINNRKGSQMPRTIQRQMEKMDGSGGPE